MSSIACGSSETTSTRQPRRSSAAADITRRHRADLAQVLREDDVSRNVPQVVDVEDRERLPAGRPLAHLAIDLRRAQVGSEGTAGDDAFHPRRRRFVALERDPDQVVVEAERVDDLGGGR